MTNNPKLEASSLSNFHDQLSIVMAWLKKNLFSNWYNSLISIGIIIFSFWLISGFGKWVFFTAQWQVVVTNLRLFFVGFYPVELLWRVEITLGILVGLGGFTWGIFSNSYPLFRLRSLILFGILIAASGVLFFLGNIQFSKLLFLTILLLVVGAFVGRKTCSQLPKITTWLPLIWLGCFLIIIWLLLGGIFLQPVRIDNLSGLLLTIFSAIIAIAISFPIGVFLALGRQSDLPVIRWLSIAYIEVIRGLPLIGILFMTQVMLGFILPPEMRPPRVIRAMAGLTLFTAAYLAENVRGGLQSIPKGQFEAAKALGLNQPLTLILIILPQAIKTVIPNIVGQFISLFKDTSLFYIVGLVDLLGISKSILSQSQFQGRYAEVYVFIGIFYWLCCYSMSFVSKKLEASKN